MKNYWTLVSLVFSLLLMATPPCNLTRSCPMGPEWEDSRAIFFEPALGDEGGMEPFFFTPHLFNIQETESLRWQFSTIYSKDLTVTDYLRNCREWNAMLGGKLPLEDVYKVIYDESPEQYLNAFEMDSLEVVYPGNAFARALNTKANKALANYLYFAKKLEFQQLGHSDPWGFNENHKGAHIRLEDLKLEAEQNLAAAASPFLEKRWAYQLLTCQYHLADTGFLRVFDAHFDMKDSSILLPWALHKLAATQKTPKSNYLLYKVFERCHSRRTQAILEFISKEAESALPYCQNAQERAGVIAMRALQNPGRGLNDLRKICRYSLKSPYIPVLIAREVNKLEDWVLSQSLTGIYNKERPQFNYDSTYFSRVSAWTQKNILKDKVYLREFVQWLKQLDNARAPESLRGVVRLAMAQLYWMQGDGWAAQQWLNRVQSSDERVTLQKSLTQCLLLPLQGDVNSLKIQQKLAVLLKELQQNQQKLSFPDKRMGRLYLYLSHAFFHKKNIPVAGLLYNRSLVSTGTDRHYGSNFYESIQFFDNLASVEDMERLIRLTEKTAKTPFETLICAPFSPEEIKIASYWYLSEETSQAEYLPVPSKAILLDVLGTIALREGHYRKAKASLDQIPSHYWNSTSEYRYYLSSDFFGAIDSLPRHYKRDTTMCKAAFVTRLLELDSIKRSNPSKRAECHYLLGNGHFEATIHGSGWLLFAYGKGWGGLAESSERPSPGKLSYNSAPRRYKSVYTGCSRAIEHYRLCLESNPSRELAAKASYMLAYCHYLLSEYNNNSVFQRWKKRYRNTQTYAGILEECPGLK